MSVNGNSNDLANDSGFQSIGALVGAAQGALTFGNGGRVGLSVIA